MDILNQQFGKVQNKSQMFADRATSSAFTSFFLKFIMFVLFPKNYLELLLAFVVVLWKITRPTCGSFLRSDEKKKHSGGTAVGLKMYNDHQESKEKEIPSDKM